MNDFCFFIATCYKDIRYARLLCQSIRYFYTELPIVIIPDGNLNIQPLKRLGNVYEFDNATVPPMFRQFKGAYGKLKTLFNDKYERFLYLDADTILIGDVLSLPYKNYDLFISGENRNMDNQKDLDEVRRYYFDPIQISHFDPDFNYQRFTTFNSGQFFARSGAIAEQMLMNSYNFLIKSSYNKRILSPLFEQGLLNYLVIKELNLGMLTIGTRSFHLHPYPEVARDYPKLTLSTVLSQEYHDKYVIHYTNPTRKFRMRDHQFGDILVEFSNQYYSKAYFFQKFVDAFYDSPFLLSWILKRIKHVGMSAIWQAKKC